MTVLEQVKQIVYSAVADLVQVESTARMRSRTLRRELVVRLDLSGVGGVDKIILSLPYYWAEYAHDGRQAINMPPGKYLIFFPDRKDDPRTSFGKSYPRTRADRRSLTDDEYKHFQAENKARRAAGLPPAMVVTRSVGPSEGEFFFTLAWEQLLASGAVDSIVSAGLDTLLRLEHQGLDRALGEAGL